MDYMDCVSHPCHGHVCFHRCSLGFIRRWRHSKAPNSTVFCLHCGVWQTLPGDDVEGMFICPVSRTQQTYHRVQQKLLQTTHSKTIDKCYGRVMHFLSLPTSDVHGTGDPRDVSRSAVLAYGYDSSSGDDNGVEHLRDDSLWDEDGNWLGTMWDEAPYKYVPPELRDPPPGRVIIDDSPIGNLRPVSDLRQQWYNSPGCDSYYKWYHDHY
jgi:hypothetical protein